MCLKSIDIVIVAALLAAGCFDSSTGETGDSGSQNDLAPPTDLKARSEELSVALSWAHEISAGAQFDVLRRMEGATEFAVVGQTDGARTYTDADPLLGRRYEYEVRARQGDAVSEPSISVSASATREPADWTLIYFLASDGDYGYDYWFNVDGLEAQGGSSDKVNVLVLWDGFAQGDSRYLVVGDSDGTTSSFGVETAEGGEVNMGDVETYRAFVDWLLPRYTARRYMLSFHDHGDGAVSTAWSGKGGVGPRAQDGDGKVARNMLFDQTSADSLDADEQAEIVAYVAEATSHKVDVVESMVCLGQMIENTFGMVGHAQYHVGPESLSYVTGTYPVSYLKQHPGADAEDVARFLFSDHLAGVQRDGVPCHWSAIDLDAVPPLVDAMADMARATSDALVAGLAPETVLDAAGKAQSYTYELGDLLSAYVDIEDLARALTQPEMPQTVRTAAAAVIAAFDDGLVLENGFNNGTHPDTEISADYGNSHGLSVFHPNSRYPYYVANAQPPYESLAFSEAASWADYLMDLTE
ncbi:MAG: clostripain-related cysteine peptidase [Deltaproteobacteria bacterium]|nr:clostripain-related cysteine peptidase [Deltaproteobacteria bacterium]